MNLVGSVEAAAILDRPHPTVKRWAASGRLPHAVKMPGDTGAYMFERSVVEALAAELVAAETAKRQARIDRLEKQLAKARAA